MEFKIVLSHGPIVWAIELVAFDLDTGREMSRFLLTSSSVLSDAQDYVRRLAAFTGFDRVVETVHDSN